jgi:lysophospholipase L1-like esterase
VSADVIARGLASQAKVRLDRTPTIRRLNTGIARTGLKLPALASVLPTIPAAATSSAITGTLWAPFQNGAAADPFYVNRYTFLRGSWQVIGNTFPAYLFIENLSVTYGNGTDVTANHTSTSAPLIRFYSAAPDLEIYFLASGSPSSGIARLRVDGQYVTSGATIGPSLTGGTGYYQRFTWGDGSETNRKIRLYEIEAVGSFRFGGVKTTNIHTIWPAPVPDRLRGIVLGDSFVEGTGSVSTDLQPNLAAQIALLLGQADCWPSGVGGTGFVANTSGTRNTFIQRVQPDVVAYAPDFIVELGGLNDNATPQATVQAAVEAWLSVVVTALPNVLIFMSGPMAPVGLPQAALTATRDAKKAAAAKYPKNAIFIDNLTTDDPWVSGVGHVGATTGSGNADWVTGSDGTHPTQEGHSFIASRVVAAIAASIPAP